MEIPVNHICSRRRLLSCLIALPATLILAGCGDGSTTAAPSGGTGTTTAPPTAARPEVQSGVQKAPMPGGGPPGGK